MSGISCSVMIPIFNMEKTVGRSLASLLAQTIEDWEAIVVDDGSTDRSAKVVGNFRDPRIKLIGRERNAGRGRARQIALEGCRGRFVAMLDADDWYYPEKLERQLAAFEKWPKLGFISCSMASVGEQGSLRGIWRAKRRHSQKEPVPPLRSLFDLDVPHAASMFRSDIARRIAYDHRLRRAEEFHFHSRILRSERHVVLDEVLYAYCDEASWRNEGPVSRYYWSALACLKLSRLFPRSAPLLAVRKSIQMVLAAITGGKTVLNLSRPSIPTPEEAVEYGRAKAKVLEHLRPPEKDHGREMGTTEPMAAI